jgi:hypothetical protein
LPFLLLSGTPHDKVAGRHKECVVYIETTRYVMRLQFKTFIGVPICENLKQILRKFCQKDEYR